MLTADTIEEKILERAELKLRMDAVVIQTGQSNKKLNGNDMLAAIRYGADKVFRGDGAPITDDDIDAIIDRGKEKTEAMKKVLEEKAKEADKDAWPPLWEQQWRDDDLDQVNINTDSRNGMFEFDLSL